MDETYFFVHVMKVGGFSLTAMMANVFRNPRFIYPEPGDPDGAAAALLYQRILQARRERGHEIRFYGGHFPYAMAEHLGPVKTLALFRDPVERLCSQLKQTLLSPLYEGWTVEKLFENPYDYGSLFDNLQLRVFAVTSLDDRKSLFEPTKLTESDVHHALDNVRRLDAIGLTEEFEDFVKILGVRFGWKFDAIHHMNFSAPREISPELRERMAAALKLDRQFYEGVREIYAERKSALLAEQGGVLPQNFDKIYSPEDYPSV